MYRTDTLIVVVRIHSFYKTNFIFGMDVILGVCACVRASFPATFYRKNDRAAELHKLPTHFSIPRVAALDGDVLVSLARARR